MARRENMTKNIAWHGKATAAWRSGMKRITKAAWRSVGVEGDGIGGVIENLAASIYSK